MSETHEEKHLQDEFFSHQQLFREAVEESAKLLRQAAEAALHSITEGRKPLVAEEAARLAAEAADDPLKPLTDQFVEKAYDQARRMFSEIEAGADQSGRPRQPFPVAGKTSERAAEEALAASAMLMNQATQHLNVAIDTVMKEMDRRLKGLTKK